MLLHWNSLFLTQPQSGSAVIIVLTEPEVYVPNSMSNVIVAIAHPHPGAPTMVHGVRSSDYIGVQLVVIIFICTKFNE